MATNDLPALPTCNCAVFARGKIVALVSLDTDRSERDAAEAVASGFTYCGSIGVNDGEPVVSYEPGRETEMARGGFLFVGLFAERVKAYQLQQKG